MKEKFKEFLLKAKLLLLSVLALATIIGAVVSDMWPKTKFNYPMLVAAVCMVLFIIVWNTL